MTLENSSSLHLPLKPDAVFKKQRASKVPIHLHDKVNGLLDLLEQNEIISPVNKEEQGKGNTSINLFIILAKCESLKIVLDAIKTGNRQNFSPPNRKNYTLTFKTISKFRPSN